jgi:hypothetical protein
MPRAPPPERTRQVFACAGETMDKNNKAKRKKKRCVIKEKN